MGIFYCTVSVLFCRFKVETVMIVEVSSTWITQAGDSAVALNEGSASAVSYVLNGFENGLQSFTV